MATDHIDEFNTMVGLILAKLYKEFPVATNLSERAIAEEMGLSWAKISDPMPSGRDFFEVLTATLIWLRDEGFIQARGLTPRDRVVLTGKALATMNAVPAGLQRKIGDRLTELAKDAGSEVGKSAIGTLVGEIFGGLVRGVAGT